jgi:hypothetical protein
MGLAKKEFDSALHPPTDPAAQAQTPPKDDPPKTAIPPPTDPTA